MMGSDNNPLISVIIPVFNSEKYLGQAIESVLTQTYRPIEVIVVDDGSTDDSAAIARTFPAPVRVDSRSHAGSAAARNQGIELAQGDWFAFLDADDLWVEGKLARQMAAFQSDPTHDLVFGQLRQFISPELDEPARKGMRASTAEMPGFVLGTMLVKRDAFFRVGQFETTWEIGEFIDWYAKAVEKGLKSLMLPEIVLFRRLHQRNQGVIKRGAQLDYVRIMKAALDRRRTREKRKNQ